MSIESAKKFLERLKHDDDLLERMKSCDSPRERTKLALSEGYSFTREEIIQVRDQFTDDDSRRTIIAEKIEPYDGPAGHGS